MSKAPMLCLEDPRIGGNKHYAHIRLDCLLLWLAVGTKLEHLQAQAGLSSDKLLFTIL